MYGEWAIRAQELRLLAVGGLADKEGGLEAGALGEVLGEMRGQEG